MTNKKVIDAFSKINIVLNLQQADQFVRYYEMLIEWNEKINLTAITESEDVLVKHFIDSVLATSVFDFKNAQTLIDIGSGAGFPGIPLKIVFPHLQVTLVDALNKRVIYLNEVINDLGLEMIEAIHGRAEDLAKTELRESFNICVSRAVSQLNVLCEYCLPFIKIGGQFISYKGARTVEELAESDNAIEVLGGKLISVTDQVELTNEIKRGFVIISKIAGTPDKYPRKAGKALKKPL